jgi:hypothetical protein
LSDIFYTDILECALNCGAKIEVTDKHKGEKCSAAAEALGWATFDVPKKPKRLDGDLLKPVMKFGGVVCPDCVEKVRAIYNQVAKEP